MKKSIIKLLVVFIGCCYINSVSAKEVKMYSEKSAPSAEEMASILLKSSHSTGKAKTRSISFGVVKKDKPKGIGLPLKFDFNSSDLKAESLVHLEQLGIMLNLDEMKNEDIMIVGHTDAEGPEMYNLDLSRQRSQAVKSFLVSHYQIDPKRIKTSGKGESDNLPGESKNSSINRRVEFFRIP